MSAANRAHEEDVDDLDDIVDEFDEGTSKPDPPLPPPVISTSETGPSKSSTAKNPQEDEPFPEDVARELAEGMEKLMRELSGGAGAGASSEDPEEARKRAQAWEKMLVDGMNGTHEDTLGPEQRPKAGPSTEDAFQASILQAMEKLKNSDSALHSDATSAAASTDDPLESILSQLTSGLDGAGDDNEELQDMLETMMQQLMSKEVLYEPLKELNDKFPAYLRENASKISAEDKDRYRNQMLRVSHIVEIFEKPDYKEDNPETGAKVVTLMNEMQSFGSPPSEIMGALPPGLDFSADGTPKIPENCIIA